MTQQLKYESENSQKKELNCTSQLEKRKKENFEIQESLLKKNSQLKETCK